MRLSFTDLKDITFRQYVNAVRSYRNEEQIKEREAWERCRFNTFYLYNVHLAKGHMKKLTDLITFSWDKPTEPLKIEFTERQLNILKKWG